MKKELTTEVESKLRRDFLDEYSTDAAIRKYTKQTAGYGISYLLDHDYANIYMQTIEQYIPKSRIQSGIRVWEFGCGGGMNLVHLITMLERRGIRVEQAIGTDFSDVLISAANQEAKQYLRPEQRENVRFCVARNEALIEDTTKGLKISKESLVGSFDFVLGVNTIRYCHRLKNENEAAAGVYQLLDDGGVCVVIDMNDKFPAFKSRLKDKLTKDAEAVYFPSLNEYARPFSDAGLEVLRKEKFCWIPHSAGRGFTNVMRAVGPVLHTFIRDRAMRSLVVSRKPTKTA